MNNITTLKENVINKTNYFEKIDKQTFSYSITNYYITPAELKAMFKQLLNDEVIDNWRLNDSMQVVVGYPKQTKK